MSMSRDASAAGRGPAAAEEMDQPTLVWQKADGSTVDIPIPADEPVTLGRDASNMVVLQSTFVSKRHATVGIEGGQFIVRVNRSRRRRAHRPNRKRPRPRPPRLQPREHPEPPRAAERLPPPEHHPKGPVRP
jgi:hypothetical protein